MAEIQFGPIKACQICTNPNLVPILSLGHQPPVHSHLTMAKKQEPELTFPLNLVFCRECLLVQLDYAVDPNILFPPEYPYNTGMTNMLILNFRELAKNLIKNYELGPQDLVIDIGSNDGTLLKGFQELGLPVLGIEPTDVANLANSRAIPTIKNFFSTSVAEKIVAEHGQARVITSTNVFAHIYDIYGVLKGINMLLADDGIFVSESQYLLDIVENLEVDTIYHEHVRYYALKPLMALFARASFSIIDAERTEAAGGSIRVLAKKGTHALSERAQKLIATEEAAGLYDEKTLLTFADRCLIAKRNLMTLLLDCKKEGATIAAIGAPGRSNTLLNFVHIDDSILSYAGERNTSPKIGLFSPGMHIPIVDEAQIINNQPEYALVLSWHIGHELMKKIRELGFKGKFIVPLPEPKIIAC